MDADIDETIRTAARIGGETAARFFREDLEIRSKGGQDLVTDADVETERVIVEQIRRRFPDHEILGEESHAGSIDAEHLWIIDPIDGTTNFAHRVPHFAVSIAYVRDGVAQQGVVWNPIRDDWYAAIRGEGATLNGKPIHVSEHTQLDESLVAFGFYYDRGPMMEATLATARDLFGKGVHGVRRFGTASLDLAQVAQGSFSAFFEYQLSPWDFAAAALIVEEAGGRVTTCTGEALPYAKSTLLASNRRLHDAMLELIHPHLGDAAQALPAQ